MKRWIYLFIAGTILYSCYSDDITANNDQIQKWELYSVTFPESTTVIQGDGLEILDELTLVSDSLFFRNRHVGTLSWELSGTYHYMEYQNDNYMVLKYDDESEIIGNCSGNSNEVFRFTSENEIYNTWSDCDGPKLQYKRQY